MPKKLTDKEVEGIKEGLDAIGSWVERGHLLLAANQLRAMATYIEAKDSGESNASDAVWQQAPTTHIKPSINN